MNRTIQRLVRSSFVRSIFFVAGGTAVAQFISFAFSPIVARLYGPEAFGVLGVFNASLMILTPLATLSFANAIAMPSAEDDAMGLFSLSVRVSIILAAVSLPPLVVFRAYVADAVGVPEFQRYLWILSPLIVAIGLEKALVQWLIRKYRFRSLAIVQTSQALALGVGKTVAGTLYPSGLTLILATAMGRLLRVGMLIVTAKTTLDIRSYLVGRQERARISRLKSSFSDFPLYRAPQDFLNSVSRSAPIIIFSSVFGVAFTGFYAMAERLLQLPISLVSHSIGRVLLPRFAAAAHAQQPLKPLIRKATVGLFLVGLIPFAAVFGFGPALFRIAFGEEWREAGVYARWLVPWLFCGFINVPAVKALPFSNSQRFLLGWEIVATAMKLSAIVIGAIVIGDGLRTIQIYSALGALMYIVLIAESYRRADMASRVRTL